MQNNSKKFNSTEKIEYYLQFYARMQDAKYSSTFSFDIFYGKTFLP